MAPERGVPINGEAVKAIRLALGVNASTLATDAALSTSFLSNIEAGRKRRVSPELRRRIAHRLDCSVDAISFVGADEAADERPADAVAGVAL